MKRTKIIVGLVAMTGTLLAFTGCKSMCNMMHGSDEAASNIQQYALHGYCPVALHKGMFLKGRNHFVTEYNGKVYTFVKLQAQKAFAENPSVFLADAAQKYGILKKKHMSKTEGSGQPMAPQYALHGYCPVALHKGMFMKGKDHFVTEYKGKVYRFLKFPAQKAFLEHPAVFLSDAAQKYEVLKKKHKAASDM